MCTNIIIIYYKYQNIVCCVHVCVCVRVYVCVCVCVCVCVLNNSRLDFYVSERIICESTLTVYYARRYIRSFEIKGNSFIRI